MTYDTLDHIKKRAVRYWYVDGLVEISIGGLMVLWGILILAISVLPTNTIKVWLLGLGQPLIIILGSILASKIVKKLKEKITYPRTGYVAYKRPTPQRRTRMVIINIFTAAGVAALVTLIGIYISQGAIYAVSAGILSLVMIYLGKTNDLNRFYWLAAFTLALGIGLGFFHLPENVNMPVLFGGFGLSWIISGTITLNTYLKTTKAPETNEV